METILDKFVAPIKVLMGHLKNARSAQDAFNVFFTAQFKNCTKTGPNSLAANWLKTIANNENDKDRKRDKDQLSQAGSYWLRKMKNKYPNSAKYQGMRFSQKATKGNFYLALIPAGDGGGKNETDDSESFADCSTTESIEKLIKRDGYEKVSQAMIIIVEAHNKADRK